MGNAACVSVAHNIPNVMCDDGDACTINDYCVEGVCKGQRDLCDDSISVPLISVSMVNASTPTTQYNVMMVIFVLILIPVSAESVVVSLSVVLLLRILAEFLTALLILAVDSLTVMKMRSVTMETLAPLAMPVLKVFAVDVNSTATITILVLSILVTKPPDNVFMRLKRVTDVMMVTPVLKTMCAALICMPAEVPPRTVLFKMRASKVSAMLWMVNVNLAR